MAETAHILVIEDDDEARMMYTIMLRSWGYKVSEATNGGEGIKLAQRHKPDLILLDVMMPDMDGYTVCEQLRRNPEFSIIPIIFMTALDAVDDRIKAFATGADDFLTKGQTNYKELHVRIQAALARTQRIHQVTTDAPEQKGLVIGVFSLSGGVGTSGLALNLAAQSVIHSNHPTLLMDLAFPVGSLGLWTGLSGAKNTHTLLSRSPTEINLPLINHYSVHHIQGFFLIPTPNTLFNPADIRADTLFHTLDLLRAQNYVVVLDLGSPSCTLRCNIPQYCDATVIVSSCTEQSRALAGIAMHGLETMGISPKSLHLVLNDVTHLQPQDLSFGLPRSPDIFIRHRPDFLQMPSLSPVTELWNLIYGS